ncbi:receptor-like protein EIX2 [Manihot esculenta]|uniref:Uncharacterized protein n=3 Tax=Manihot esculenta TaxID=3983 RepID=A0ACB7IC42_MANES|nr:receptor-like protein EIX2 [Manihot esculenta]XP_021622760.2 receptor-like protein EIX2 [Manihot esculenta]KAG8661799.1 hypothetical protein MANES_01G039156v8 [Manihot esculenta]KAG8661800.1 hypothetical protein MANES_01G039156v8 [Manihot esculenta]
MGTSTANVVEILALLILLQSVSSFCNGDNFNGSCIKTEREALVKFKSSLVDNSNSLPSWVGDDCCRWDGVTCDDITGHVVNLVLSWTSIRGNISLHLGNLSNLHYLDLSLNPSLAIHSLHFPSSLKYLNLTYVLLDKCENWLQSINMLPSLLELQLRNCELSIIGDVSHVNFTSLEVLDLGLNNFHSTIPSWLYNITKLQNLVLQDNAFRGSLSTDISNLNSLASLDADFNSLEGNIPNTLNRLCNLIELHLGYNKFGGEISGTFGNSSGCIKNSLENLILLNNSFSGSIPDNLGQFKRLKGLFLSKNSFWGSIPVSIGQLYNLETLGLSQNSLHGKVSELHLLNLRSLMGLSMDGNSLVFDIDPEWIPPFQLHSIGLSSCEVGPSFPQWLKTQKSIRFLEMSNASISDNIPDWFENISSNIVRLDLSYNQLFGTLPTFRKLNTTYASYLRFILLKSNQFDGFLTCSHFDATILDISNNLLHGQIPQNISDTMPSLRLLSLSNNYLNGTVPATLCRIESLQILDLSNNHLSGRIPSCWGNLPSLTVIDFSSNMLSGEVPMSLGSQESLVSLHLQNNTLQGKIPMSLRYLESLETLDLSMNSFDGFIPSWIGESLSSLKVLSIHSNKFEGEIPLQLCYLASLRILNLANNMMTGTIPNCFGNFTAIAMHEQKGHWDYYPKGVPLLYVTAGYGENVQVYVKGIELEYTRTLQFLYSIDLSGNNFVGEIPQELMNLSGLQILNLSTNKLYGHIPWNIGKLSSLESLDLSENELSGSIPFSISDLNFLSHLNLSFNHLSGRIPKGNQLQTLDDKSIYIGNDGLCGPPLNNCSDDADELPKGHEKGGTTRKDDSEMVWFYSGMGMGFAAGFVGVCSILYFNDSWRCAWFGLVDRVYNKLWVTIAIKANQVKRKFLRNKLEGNA